eukprot:TRINITY_DN22332_c0_g1_i1.p3 TRINITY_DN22332_c0_g1~~TRINITY_DN22332_c0_g1_i1.p3  ORF type:complete len:117 (+),score=39.69 TRINITY_DN22332_c0_g1_i1:72-422(+)
MIRAFSAAVICLLLAITVDARPRQQMHGVIEGQYLVQVEEAATEAEYRAIKAACEVQEPCVENKIGRHEDGVWKGFRSLTCHLSKEQAAAMGTQKGVKRVEQDGLITADGPGAMGF